MGNPFYRNEFVKCGRKGCRKCPHGPYWYCYWYEGKRLRKKYIGKNFKPEEKDNGEPCPQNPLDAIFDKGKATLRVAKSILELTDDFSMEACRRVYRKLSLENHPDRGGDTKKQARINAAFEFMERYWAFAEPPWKNGEH